MLLSLQSFMASSGVLRKLAIRKAISKMFDRAHNTSLARSAIKEKNLLWISKADKMMEVIL